MENERVLIAMDKQSFKDVLNELFNQNPGAKITPEFEGDRLTKTEAARLIRVSLPTLDRYLNAGKFKQYGVGHKKYFLKSEVIEVLKGNS